MEALWRPFGAPPPFAQETLWRPFGDAVEAHQRLLWWMLLGKGGREEERGCYERVDECTAVYLWGRGLVVVPIKHANGNCKVWRGE